MFLAYFIQQLNIECCMVNILLISTIGLLIGFFKSKLNNNYPNLVQAPSLFYGHFKEFLHGPEGFLIKMGKLHEDVCTIRFFNKKIILLNSFDKIQLYFCGKIGACISDRPSSYLTKLISKNGKGILFRPHGKELYAIRNHLLAFFHYISNLDFEAKVTDKFNLTFEPLKESVRRHDGPVKIVNFKEYLEQYLTDYSATILFGRSLNSTKLNELLNGVVFNLQNTTMFNIITMLPIYRFIPNSLFNKMLNNSQKMQKFIDDLLKDYKYEWKKKMESNELALNHVTDDLLNYLLYESIKDQSSKAIMDDDDIVIASTTIFLSFFESVSASINWFLFYLAKHPEYQDKCRQEVKEYLNVSVDILKFKNEKSFLNSCIKESMRLSSLVPIVSHLTSDDVLVDGYLIPKGTPVMANVYSIHLNDKNFHNATQFKPERWLNEQAYNEKNLLAFCTGKRSCIGKFISKDLIFLSACLILKQFKLSVSDELVKKNENDLVKFGVTRVLDQVDFQVELI